MSSQPPADVASLQKEISELQHQLAQEKLSKSQLEWKYEELKQAQAKIEWDSLLHNQNSVQSAADSSAPKHTDEEFAQLQLELEKFKKSHHAQQIELKEKCDQLRDKDERMRKIHAEREQLQAQCEQELARQEEYFQQQLQEHLSRSAKSKGEESSLKQQMVELKNQLKAAQLAKQNAEREKDAKAKELEKVQTKLNKAAQDTKEKSRLELENKELQKNISKLEKRAAQLKTELDADQHVKGEMKRLQQEATKALADYELELQKSHQLQQDNEFLKSENLKISKELDDEKAIVLVLDAKLKQLSAESEAQQRRRQELEREIVQSHQQLAEWKTQGENIINGLSQEKYALQQSLGAKELECQEQREQIASLAAQAKKLDQDVSKLTHENGQISNELIQAKQMLNETEKHLMMSREEVGKLQSTVDDLQLQLHGAQSNSNELLSQKSRLDTENALQKDQIQSLRKEIVSLQQELRDTKAALEQIRDQLRQKSTQCEDLHRECQESSHQRLFLENELNNAKTAYQRLQQDYSTVTTESQNLHQQRASWRSQEVLFKEAIQKYEQMLSVNNAQLLELQQQQLQDQNELQTRHQKIEDLRQQLRNAEQSALSITKERDQLQTELEDHRGTKEQLDHWMRRFRKLEEENKRLAQMLEDEQTKVHLIPAALPSPPQQVQAPPPSDDMIHEDDVRALMEEYEQQLKELQLDCEDYKNRCEELERERDDRLNDDLLDRELTRLENENRQLKGENEALKAEAQALRQQQKQAASSQSLQKQAAQGQENTFVLPAPKLVAATPSSTLRPAQPPIKSILKARNGQTQS